MSEERVTVELSDGVAMVTLRRGERHNALDGPMFDGIVAAAERVRELEGVRAVVLSGEGPSFCSGLDYPAVGAEPDRFGHLLDQADGDPANNAQRTGYEWQRLEVPVIAAIQGHCLGGGLQIALGADIRIVAPDARLSVMEIKYGLVPDMSITQTLPRLVGADVAKELTFTGMVVSGEEAVRMGLCTRASAEPLADARELAMEIATKSPDAIRAGKLLLERAYASPGPHNLEHEATLQKSLLGQPNQIEAAMAALEKREPSFEEPEPG